MYGFEIENLRMEETEGQEVCGRCVVALGNIRCRDVLEDVGASPRREVNLKHVARVPGSMILSEAKEMHQIQPDGQ